MSRTASTSDPGTHLATYRSTRWSTRVDLVVTDPALVIPAARLLDDEMDRVEVATSRFREDSEISRLHRGCDGSPVPVSRDCVDAVRIALRAAGVTDGAVDPTVGAALVRLGYDRDFPEVAGGVAGTLPGAAAVPGWRSVVVDGEAGTIATPAGTLLDLGATAKAWAADRAADAIAGRLGCGVLVSLGGDLAVRAAPAGGFTVAVSDVCGDPDAPTAVSIVSGGLATSGTGNRHWTLGGSPVHHVVDPATGLPVATVWRTATVAAGTAVDANTASTAALVLGGRAPAWLAARRLPARLVAHDGTVTTVAGWPEDTAPRPVDVPA